MGWHSLTATGHPSKGQPVPGNWHVYPEVAPAGLWTTPSDLVKVGIEMQRAVKGESKWLSRELAEQMLAPQVEGSVSDNTTIGIGFFLEGKGASMRFGHGGSNEGFLSQATFYKTIGKGAVIMINSSEGWPLIAEIERAIAREYDWPDYFPKEKQAANVSPAAIDAMLGQYETQKGMRFVVERKEGRLLLTVGKQPPIEIVPYEEMKCFIPDLNTDVVYRKAEGGGVDRLVIEQEGKALEATRRKE